MSFFSPKDNDVTHIRFVNRQVPKDGVVVVTRPAGGGGGGGGSSFFFLLLFSFFFMNYSESLDSGNQPQRTAESLQLVDRQLKKKGRNSGN